MLIQDICLEGSYFYKYIKEQGHLENKYFSVLLNGLILFVLGPLRFPMNSTEMILLHHFLIPTVAPCQQTINNSEVMPFVIPWNKALFADARLLLMFIVLWAVVTPVD